MSENEISTILYIVLIIMIAILMVLSVIFLVLSRKGKKKEKRSEESIGGQTKGKSAKNNKETIVSYNKQSIVDFMEFEKIEDNMIVIKSGKKYVMVVECQGVNYDLMSKMEKVAVEEGFQQFLNTLRHPIQIYIQTRTVNLESSIQTYKDKVKEIENKYREEIKQDSKFGVDFVKSKHLRLLVHPRYIHIFKEHGYDGIICPMEEFRGVKGALEYAVISPNQIKSIDNQGTFSLQSSNIYEKVITSFGGKVPISSKDKDQIQKFCKKAVEDGMKPTKYTEEEMGGIVNSSNFSSSSIASNTPENPIKVTNLGEEKLEEAYVVCSLDGQVVDGTYTTDLARAKAMRQELADEYHTFFKLMTVQDKEEPMEEALEKKKDLCIHLR